MNGSPRPGVIERYRDFLPVSDATPRLTIGEGDTPLVRAASLERRLGSSEVWLKLEGCNPTGSFKDRGIAMAAAKAIEEGAHSFICASTGNTAASAAAFGARSSIPTGVIIPARGVALGKVAQALIYGARVVPIQGTFDDGLALVRELAARPGVALVNSVNPYRLEGQQTAAFRGRRHPWRCAGRAVRPGRQRRQYHGVLEGVSRVPGRRPGHAASSHARVPGGGRGAHRRGRAGCQPRHRGLRHSDRQSGQLGACCAGAR